MIKYFIKLDEEQKGPLSIEELKGMNLTDQYLYWTDGLPSWRKITEIKEKYHHLRQEAKGIEFAINP